MFVVFLARTLTSVHDAALPGTARLSGVSESC
jgi:hypothetical protein